MKYNHKALIILSISTFIIGLIAGYFFSQGQLSKNQERQMERLQADIVEKDLELRAYQISTDSRKAQIKILRDMLADAENAKGTRIAP